MIIACATDDKINLIQEHFGDAKYYNIYSLDKDNISYIKSIKNTVVSNVHPDPSKAKKILKLLEELNTDILINRAFGTNITIIKKYVTPVMIRTDVIEDALDLINRNYEEINEVIKEKNDVYLIINNESEMRKIEIK